MSQKNKKEIRYRIECWFDTKWSAVWFGDDLATAKKAKKELEEDYPSEKFRIVKVTTIKEIVE